MRGLLVLGIAVALAMVGAPLRAAGRAASRPPIDVVFVLDTTGSMGGLIETAKEKIWAVANTLATAKPTPRIRMGLVGYRDRRDAYVTRRTALTDDLDAVYEALMGFRAEGGGDGPESVNQALHEAVTKMAWSSDRRAYRVIFLVGDYPPHMDYQDDVKYPETCRRAVEKGITINTIQCGTYEATAPIWKEIARRSEGTFARVEQSGGAVRAPTPYDERLAALARELDGTRLYYGTAAEQAAGEKRARAADEIAARAPMAGQASRAAHVAREAADVAADPAPPGMPKDLATEVRAARAGGRPEGGRAAPGDATHVSFRARGPRGEDGREAEAARGGDPGTDQEAADAPGSGDAQGRLEGGALARCGALPLDQGAGGQAGHDLQRATGAVRAATQPFVQPGEGAAHLAFRWAAFGARRTNP
ncbi:MAG: VWA domain-containing protein [Armatimonadetes bacterium]|nr:VWA domain-containing protein [Armatimonadota bacterium]